MPPPSASPARPPRRPLREVCFVKYFEKGSTDIGADQMAAALRRRGVASRALPVRELAGVRDSVVIFVKRADLSDLLLARARGNVLALDVQDTLVFRRGLRWSALYDGIIFRNRRAWADFGRGRPGSVAIPHHWDERYRPHRAGTDALRTVFIGDRRSWPWAEPLPGVELVLDDWFTRALDFNAHFSVRRPGREWLYKPNLKVATAAACGAVLITTPDESAREHLGDDYPFYVGPTREEAVAGIRRAERLLGGAEWQAALAKLAAVRAAVTLERITDLYVDYLSRFGELMPQVSEPLPVLDGGHRHAL